MSTASATSVCAELRIVETSAYTVEALDESTWPAFAALVDDAGRLATKLRGHPGAGRAHHQQVGRGRAAGPHRGHAALERAQAAYQRRQREDADPDPEDPRARRSRRAHRAPGRAPRTSTTRCPPRARAPAACSPRWSVGPRGTPARPRRRVGGAIPTAWGIGRPARPSDPASAPARRPGPAAALRRRWRR